MVLDVWQSRRATEEQVIGDLTVSLAGLQRREALLDEAFLFARSIDGATYERQHEKVRQEIRWGLTHFPADRRAWPSWVVGRVGRAA